jgi:hypothetical protein
LDEYSDDFVARLRSEVFANQIDDKAVKAVFNISDATLERRVRSGMPHYRVGRLRLFDVNEIREWVLSHRVSAPARHRGRPRKATS